MSNTFVVDKNTQQVHLKIGNDELETVMNCGKKVHTVRVHATSLWVIEKSRLCEECLYDVITRI